MKRVKLGAVSCAVVGGLLACSTGPADTAPADQKADPAAASAVARFSVSSPAAGVTFEAVRWADFRTAFPRADVGGFKMATAAGDGEVYYHPQTKAYVYVQRRARGVPSLHRALSM